LIAFSDLNKQSVRNIITAMNLVLAHNATKMAVREGRGPA